jgi:hypothetical protein
MMSQRAKLLLVGDNPFHGISHLSQQRSRSRFVSQDPVSHAASLVKLSLENGAQGFMFSVSETTLSILRKLRENGNYGFKLYAIVPYAYEYVRLATQVGGISGLGRRVGKQIVLSMNVSAILNGLRSVASMDLRFLMKTYISYEISRIKSAIGKRTSPDVILLHELITEMALAFDMDWFFRSYIEFLQKQGIRPGFETRNFAYLVAKFKKWNLDFDDICITSSFNEIGFQMNPSKEACEKALSELKASHVIAMSVLAAGYFKPPDVVEYLRSLRNISGIVMGVSKEYQARETFSLLKQSFS